MTESDRVSLASTIGTWVAAFLALVALIAVIGPVLIWAAARTERNKAIQDAGDAKQSVITSGIKFVGFDVRLFRRIHAPILDKMPDGPTLVWDAARFTETKSRATWVQFANLLLAYGVAFERGNSLVIYRGKAIIPIHRVWILVIGLIGRYSTKKSRPLRNKSKRTLSVLFRPSNQDSPEDDTVESATWPTRVVLNGTTGQIKIIEKFLGLGLTESSIAIFLPRPISEFAGIEAEKLPLQDLLILAIGCLPLPSRHYISLVDMWIPGEPEPDYPPMYMDILPSVNHGNPTTTMSSFFYQYYF
jgi:hypothetical protein